MYIEYEFRTTIPRQRNIFMTNSSIEVNYGWVYFFMQ